VDDSTRATPHVLRIARHGTQLGQSFQLGNRLISPPVPVLLTQHEHPMDHGRLLFLRPLFDLPATFSQHGRDVATPEIRSAQNPACFLVKSEHGIILSTKTA
jgi:hypothetical protein